MPRRVQSGLAENPTGAGLGPEARAGGCPLTRKAWQAALLLPEAVERVIRLQHIFPETLKK